MTWAASALLSKTVLRGEPSSFVLELPPYRLPRVGQTLVRSLLDRTVFVLGRAVTASAPCGLCIWLAERLTVGGEPLMERIRTFLDPAGRALGMDGILLAAFLFAFPAAELTLPLALAGAGGGIEAVALARGWGTQTFLCVIMFTLFLDRAHAILWNTPFCLLQLHEKYV